VSFPDLIISNDIGFLACRERRKIIKSLKYLPKPSTIIVFSINEKYLKSLSLSSLSLQRDGTSRFASSGYINFKALSPTRLLSFSDSERELSGGRPSFEIHNFRLAWRETTSVRPFYYAKECAPLRAINQGNLHSTGCLMQS